MYKLDMSHMIVLTCPLYLTVKIPLPPTFIPG